MDPAELREAEEENKALEQQLGPPFSEPGQTPSSISSQDPRTDDQLDSDELYDEGIEGAVESSDPEHEIHPDDYLK